MFMLDYDLRAYEPVDVGWLCLLPPLLTMVVALISKEVVISLLLGAIVAILIYIIKSHLSVVQMIQVFFSILMSRAASNMAICLFTFLMGSLVKLMEKSGGTRAFCNWFSKCIKGRRMTLMIGVFVSSFLFLDDYFNIITTSAIMRAIFERNNISKPKAAYQIHTVASNLCILSPISSWAAVVIAQIEDCGIKEAFSVYTSSLILNAYPICCILGLFFFNLTGIEVGGMQEYEEEAKRAPSSIQEELVPSDSESSGHSYDLIVPVISLIVSTVLYIFYLGDGFRGRKSIQQIFTDSDSAVALLYASFTAILIAFLLYIPRRVLSFRVFVEEAKEGMKVMLDTLIILVLAWTVGGVDSTLLQTGDYVGNLITRCHLPFWIIPSVVFLVGALLTFSLGTTWAGFSVLVPIVVSICTKTDRTLLVPCISACLCGSVFGDNISPICDNTILVSSCVDCNFIVHVKTEAVYAVTMAIISFIGYLIVGFTGGNVWFSVGIPVFLEAVVLGSVALLKRIRVIRLNRNAENATPKEDNLVLQINGV